MHEMGIANSILTGVTKELQRRPGARAVKVGVRIGELAGVDPDALSFAFEALTLDTEFAGLAIDIEYVPPRSRCRECRREFEVRNYELLCPACGGLNTERISGDELEFTYLEIDEPELAETACTEPQLAESKTRELEVEKQ
jgi:hydrogenase nickel incorporation protein HypA/HybF